MQIRIHRGTQEIGGTCIELEAAGKRLLLDLGLPLDGDVEDDGIHPKIEGLAGSPDLLALILSHGHVDHWGLAHLAGPNIPVALGAATHRILQAAAPFVPRPYLPAQPVEFTGGTPLTFGPFTVTPNLVDHSAYDAYALEVEAGGCRLFYSGDVRAHGRKAALFERMVAHPPRNIDVLLLEGSTFGRLNAEHRFPTEHDVEAQFVDIFQRTEGMALVAASAQNIDRMVSLYRACKRTGRTLIIDLYAAEVLRATGNANIPQSDWPNMAVYVPQYQRVRIKQSGRFDLLEPHKPQRIFGEDLKARAATSAFLFRPAMLPDLDRAECLTGARAVWSQWDGYLKQPRGEALCAELEKRQIPLEHAHTSGHAAISDLQRLAKAVGPKMLVPIHTFEAHRFPDFFDNVTVRRDGEWWSARTQSESSLAS
ncbi:MBL fold metallo-hydrolase [Aquabacter sp. CN5-332]|uniref:MBL fold metallo-hydrolase n=1 Tax=Aquabacter sp. CN5-332 TaxID=3156608 RepID=UPI0032B52DC7